MWRCVEREDAYVEVVGRMWRCVKREDVEVCGEDVEVCREGGCGGVWGGRKDGRREGKLR